MKYLHHEFRFFEINGKNQQLVFSFNRLHVGYVCVVCACDEFIFRGMCCDVHEICAFMEVFAVCGLTVCVHVCTTCMYRRSGAVFTYNLRRRVNTAYIRFSLFHSLISRLLAACLPACHTHHILIYTQTQNTYLLHTMRVYLCI